jgi:hypothetical protein
MAQVFVPVQAASFATISPADTGRASTLYNASRQLGGAIGVALLTTTIVIVGPLHVVDAFRPGAIEPTSCCSSARRCAISPRETSSTARSRISSSVLPSSHHPAPPIGSRLSRRSTLHDRLCKWAEDLDQTVLAIWIPLLLPAPAIVRGGRRDHQSIVEEQGSDERARLQMISYRVAAPESAHSH